MKPLPQISEAEFEVMKIIWKYLLKRLVTKKAITYEKDSRIFVYTPLVMEDEYINQESNLFLKRFYNGNLSSMLSAYIENDRLSPSEIDTLRGILSDFGHKGGA